MCRNGFPNACKVHTYGACVLYVHAGRIRLWNSFPIVISLHPLRLLQVHQTETDSSYITKNRRRATIVSRLRNFGNKLFEKGSSIFINITTHRFTPIPVVDIPRNNHRWFRRITTTHNEPMAVTQDTFGNMIMAMWVTLANRRYLAIRSASTEQRNTWLSHCTSNARIRVCRSSGWSSTRQSWKNRSDASVKWVFPSKGRVPFRALRM